MTHSHDAHHASSHGHSAHEHSAHEHSAHEHSAHEHSAHEHSAHGHSHASREHLPQETLEQGHGRVLFVDAFCGVSGDMFISGLLDVGVPFSVLQKTMEALPIDGFRMERGTRTRHGVVASSFDVHVDGTQVERHWCEIDTMIPCAELPRSVISKARAIFRWLAEAESHVHGLPVCDVHFHEVGAVDAIVDIVGAAALVSYLAPSRIVCSPLPIGHGTVHARHGVLPLPAPSTVGCLRGVPTYGVDVEGELVTPTGAAIVATLADEFAHWPAMVVDRMGFGSGSMEWKTRPNLLRVVLGKETEAQSCAGSEQASGTHTVLETNVDDMTGEFAGHAQG